MGPCVSDVHLYFSVQDESVAYVSYGYYIADDRNSK